MNPATAGLCRLGFNLGDAIIDGARTVVPRLGELVIAAAMRAAERELVTLAGGVHDRQLTAMLASHSNVSGGRWVGEVLVEVPQRGSIGGTRSGRSIRGVDDTRNTGKSLYNSFA